MALKGIFSDTFKSGDGLNFDRGYIGGPMNPFGSSYISANKYNTPYQFPSTISDSNPFVLNGGTFDSTTLQNSNGYGLKLGGGTGYGHTEVATQTQYGPPQTNYGPPVMMHGSSGGGGGGKTKLKGAALSALTLLAFLFFLNLLQNCLKEQMDTMNPTVMVMSAGQRATYIARNDGYVDSTDSFDGADTDKDYETTINDDYQLYSLSTSDDAERTSTKSRTRIRDRNSGTKQHKSKAHAAKLSTIRPKLQNMLLLSRSSSPVTEAS